MKRAVVYDVSAIRAKCQIKGFGGVASGPAPLIELFRCERLVERHVG